MAAFVVFSDLDGTLLDSGSYSFDAAREALDLLRRQGIPLVLVSSKTRAEIEPLRARLQNTDPFIVENGGGLFVPEGYFRFVPEGSSRQGSYHVVVLGTPYPRLRQALAELRQAIGTVVRGFGDMTVEEIVERTGLTPAEAALARRREYDEPFALDGPPELLAELTRLAEARRLHVTSGGRFHHLMGPSDKGRACRELIRCYRRHYAAEADSLQTIALGDSLNDLPLLAAVDRPVLVQKPEGSYDPAIQLPNLIRAPGIGPAGWNRALLELLQKKNRSQR
jgi:mannosyl-3-phosphoglycerate phosphatase